MRLVNEVSNSVHRNPEQAERLARETLRAPEMTDRDRALALWVLGRAQHELDRVGEATATLDSARRTAETGGDEVLAAEISVSEAGCLLATGDTDDALARLHDAEPHLDGGPRGRLVMQRGLIASYRGAMDDALVDFEVAIGLLLDAGDDLARCQLLANRGVVHVTLGRVDAGEQDFLECRALAERLDQGMIAARAAHNLGFLSGRNGAVPRALEWFEVARAEYERVGFPARATAVLETDLCSVLLAAGLTQEATVAATRACAAAAASGNELSLADALLQSSRASLAEESFDEAVHAATRASGLFAAAGRRPLAALSEYVALRAVIASGVELSSTSTEQAGAILAELDRHGWVNEAHDVRIFIGRAALHAGDRELAASTLGRAAEARRRGQWSTRASGWLALAVLRADAGDRRGARRALRAGMKVIDAHQATLGAADLRAHATAHGAELVQLGLQLARDEGDHRLVLQWAERAHARSMRLPSVRPPKDGRLARLLAELRVEHARAAHTAAAGQHDERACAEIRRLETEVRSVSRTASRIDPTARPASSLDDVVGSLGGRVLIEQVRVGAELVAIVIVDGVVATHGLGPFRNFDGIQRQALSALRRLGFGGIRPQALEAARSGLHEVGEELDAALIEPLEIPHRVPVVLVPAGTLRSLPWSILPSLASRPFAIAPSASTWARQTRPRSGGGRALLVAGPELAHADAEIEAIRHLHNEVVLLDSSESTIDRVLREMARADVVHIAAHGSFRNDSPLFSAIHLADGPLTVYDLDYLSSPPSVVVLSACEAGRQAVRGGDELLGTASALLHIGASAVVAPVTTVPDEAVVPLMTDLHRGLRRGLDVATALAEAGGRAVTRGTHADVAAAKSFVAVVGDRSIPQV